MSQDNLNNENENYVVCHNWYYFILKFKYRKTLNMTHTAKSKSKNV